MYKTTFSADFLGSTVEGWTDGSTWNGWATPYFEFKVAQRIVEIFNNDLGTETASYNSTMDTFCFNLDDEECFGGQIIEVGGQKLKVYGIGTGNWIWEVEASIEY